MGATPTAMSRCTSDVKCTPSTSLIAEKDPECVYPDKSTNTSSLLQCVCFSVCCSVDCSVCKYVEPVAACVAVCFRELQRKDPKCVYLDKSTNTSSLLQCVLQSVLQCVLQYVLANRQGKIPSGCTLRNQQMYRACCNVCCSVCCSVCCRVLQCVAVCCSAFKDTCDHMYRACCNVCCSVCCSVCCRVCSLIAMIGSRVQEQRRERERLSECVRKCE